MKNIEKSEIASLKTDISTLNYLIDKANSFKKLPDIPTEDLSFSLKRSSYLYAMKTMPFSSLNEAEFHSPVNTFQDFKMSILNKSLAQIENEIKIEAFNKKKESVSVPVKEKKTKRRKISLGLD